MQLESDGRVIFDLPKVNHLKGRVRDLLGRQLAESLVAVANDAEGVQLTGFVAHPSQARPTSRRQFYILNGRPIHDKLLVAAVREGYAGFCEPRLHGAVVLHLDTDPSLVDVNVHPTKHEVRFRRSGEVFRLVRDAVRGALEANRGSFELLGGPVTRRTVHQPLQPAEPTVITQERFIPQRPEDSEPVAPSRGAQHVAESGEGAAGASAGAVYRADLHSVDMSASTGLPESAVNSAVGDAVGDAAGDNAALSAAAGAHSASEPQPVQDKTSLPPGVRRVIQLRESFLLVETDAGIRIIDQHALHEKALYLALDPAITDLPGSGRQELLIPITVELSAAEVAGCEPHLSSLQASGIEAEVFGPTTLLVRSHPTLLRRLDWPGFFADLAAQKPDGDAVADLRVNRPSPSVSCRGQGGRSFERC